jgi:micrococcal nuclease
VATFEEALEMNALRLHLLVLLVITLTLGSAGLRHDVGAAARLSPSEAGAHIGEEATVCGVVASATFAARSRRQPTFLNLDKPYPNHIFTAVIWGADRPAFSPPPEVAYRDKRICVTGLIKEYKQRPEVIVTRPSQIAVSP